jgi:hypothetical protein
LDLRHKILGPVTFLVALLALGSEEVEALNQTITAN